MILLVHDELQIRVNGELQTSQIDEFNLSSSDSEINDILSEIKNIFNNIKEDIKNGFDVGIEKIADEVKSLQEFYITSNGSVKSGNLLSSIEIRQQGRNDYLIGTIITEIYPLCIENGRKEVRPVNAKVLRWYDGSSPVFSMYSSATKPKPFVQPSFEDIEDKALDILSEALDNVIY